MSPLDKPGCYGFITLINIFTYKHVTFTLLTLNNTVQEE